MSLSADRSRDLLFGMLTLQHGLIDENQFIAAVQSWAGSRERPLADHIAARGQLDQEQRADIEALVTLQLAECTSVADQSWAAAPRGQSNCEPRVRVCDAETEVSEANLGLASTQAGESSGRGGRYVGVPAVPAGQRFRVLRSHARGGLGAVFVAVDTELNREVAVKQILDHHADDPVSRARFVVEAEVTGGLEHPGIVPVYSLGADDGGRPYYAMRFIRGDSLKEVIERFHADPELKVDAGRRSLQLRKLLRRFTDVCNAIEYAHNRGVLHRDIKPGNIIVGHYGETLVVDWGLAKLLARVDDPALPSGEEALDVSQALGSTETLPGSTLGTPAYMSPEQAAGHIERLGPWSDVYSLGATLYSLLTGKPPFEGNDVAAILESVRKGDFIAPRHLDPSIAKGLEAVCLKAMAFLPEHRYASSRALADDIELWLADEPVAAYRERPVERLGRWLRRHRTWTLAAAAGLIGISLAAIVGATLIEGGRRREEIARKEAETNFVMAQNAVKDYLTSVSENTLLKQQDSVDIRSLRRELLNTALKYYKNFVDQRSGDPGLRRELATAYYRVGEITQDIGSRVEAIAAFQKAQSIWEALAVADGGNPELQGRVVDCCLSIGKQKGADGDLKGGMMSLTRARAILETLAARSLDPVIVQPRLADCYSEIGSIEGRLQSGDHGLASLEKARAIQQALVDRYPGQIGYRRRLVEIINVLGFVYNKRLDNAAAIRCFEEVRATLPVSARTGNNRSQTGQAGQSHGPRPLQYRREPDGGSPV